MNIHILGIAGTMTAPLALELKNKGHQVSGSDQEKIYPPISDVLKNITLNQKIDFNTIDLFIIGSSYNKFENCRQEFETIKKLKKK
jgi:UDP-N-acetylmuramate-alanine ligase